MKKINIFGKDIEIREYGCANKNNCPYPFRPERLNLFIQVTQKCNANCLFCEYHTPEEHKFDIDKLDMIIKELCSKIHIGKVNLTGGEPTLDMVLFDEIIGCVQDNFDNRGSLVTLNTNGINLDKLKKYQYSFDILSLSRHHYNDDKNIEIFNTKLVPNMQQIIEFQQDIENKEMLFIRCNLIKNYIDNQKELEKFLDHVIMIGARNCGFVTLMPLNQYCLDNQIDFAGLIDESNENFLKSNYWTRFDKETLSKEVCQCRNYIYSNKDGMFCKFFSRYFCNASLNEGQLVYDGKYLYEGFGGKIII